MWLYFIIPIILVVFPFVFSVFTGNKWDPVENYHSKKEIEDIIINNIKDKIKNENL
jgi:heme/copper-type cytochrome/quinol oxidase subunit 2